MRCRREFGGVGLKSAVGAKFDAPRFDQHVDARGGFNNKADEHLLAKFLHNWTLQNVWRFRE